MAEAPGGFVKKESVARVSGVWALNFRLFGSLPLFLWLLPLSLVTVVLSSAAPSLFRWYSGKLSASSAPVTVNWLPGHPQLDFSAGGLFWVTTLAISLRITAWALFEISGMWSSQRLHARMVASLGRTRTTFFDENPSARVINRLIRDFDEVRSTAIIFVGDLLNASVEVMGVAVVAALANPAALLAVIPLFAVFSWIQAQRSAMLDHARTLSAVATSQVLGRKTDLIEGREIFLLYGRGDALLARMREALRELTQATAFTVGIDTWSSFWMRASAEGFAFVALVLCVLALRSGEIDAPVAGVVISALFGITGSMGWLDMATGLVSRSAPHVRRVFEYIDLPPEEAEEKADAAVGDGAGAATDAKIVPGTLAFRGYTMSYRSDTAVVLNGLDLEFPLGSKTALIGRTGSGKTSITQALLRMVYVRGGELRVGDRSAFDLDLRAYRRLFGVVPQAPYLFEGTVRTNLDRRHRESGAEDQVAVEASEERLLAALRAVGLSLELNHPVSEGGLNLSVGERQLVCLARVIAADRPYILLDEPTSGLDPVTDARVTQVLRTALKDRTVITIAHRRESLAHYDRVVEIGDGRVV